MLRNGLFILSYTFGRLSTVVWPYSRWSLLDIWATGVFGYVLYQSVRKKRFPEGKMIVPMTLFAIICIAVTVLRMPGWAEAGEFLYIGRWFVYAGTYIFILQTKKSQAAHWLIVLFVSGVCLAGGGLVQRLWYPDLRNITYAGWDPHYLRVFSSLLDPNFSGSIFALTIVLGLSLRTLLFAKHIWIDIGMMLSCGALALTYSRSSLLGLVSGIIVWCVVRKMYRSVVIGMMILFVVLLILPRGWEGQNLLRITSSVARIGSFHLGVQKFLSAPVFGQGFLPKQEIVPEYGTPIQRTGSVDSSFLYVLAASGLIGFFAYIYLWWNILQFAREPKHNNVFGPLVSASVAVVLMHSVFTNSALYPWVMMWMWIVVGATERYSMART